MSQFAPFYSNTHSNAATGSLCKVQEWVSIDPPTHTSTHTPTHPPEQSLRGQGDYQRGVGQKRGDSYHIIQTIKETFHEQQFMVLCVLSV